MAPKTVPEEIEPKLYLGQIDLFNSMQLINVQVAGKMGQKCFQFFKTNFQTKIRTFLLTLQT